MTMSGAGRPESGAAHQAASIFGFAAEKATPLKAYRSITMCVPDDSVRKIAELVGGSRERRREDRERRNIAPSADSPLFPAIS